MSLHKSRGKGLFQREEVKNVPDFQEDFQKLAIWTNIKAKLARTGPSGNYYPNFKDFIAIKLHQHMYIYIFNDLSPSPYLEIKFNTQVINQIYANYFIASTLLQNSIGLRQHYAMFKAFLSIQNPLIDPPPSAKCSNWKTCPMLSWINFIFSTAWLLGIKVVINEISIGFQGMHIDKRQTTYKAEDNGFQADALADEGYCYKFFVLNDPPPKKKSIFAFTCNVRI